MLRGKTIKFSFPFAWLRSFSYSLDIRPLTGEQDGMCMNILLVPLTCNSLSRTDMHLLAPHIKYPYRALNLVAALVTKLNGVPVDLNIPGHYVDGLEWRDASTRGADPTSGFKDKTYATQWLRKHVRDLILDLTIWIANATIL